MIFHSLDQAGDTIVEVMVVLAVLGLAISISYATASRSLLNARQAQENSTASLLLQSQLETLRTFAANKSTSPNYIYRPSFCIDSTGNVSLSPPCVFHNNLYNVTITYAASVGGQDGGTFTLGAQWLDVTGDGNDSVALVYRLYP
jgi:prepilin-type N-terminal cleavage/methylation domain-containing protein